ncbi:hypothetical protein RZS28_15345 [Methylocapsa polymorpha]|uniref:LTXXQ motif family protein n=1 Tax=Methylocapsa polymorpha TaxID=3080828 RepID=A0ABZ0HRX6_9HYPH|nr:hypothetical protein RZS28_15345 [Methylocapsa sp. RX1]
MQKNIGSSLAAMGVAVALVLPSAYAAQSRSYRDDRTERPTLSVNQIVDRAEARIAELKANLRLSDEQAKHWPGLESALRDIATKRAKSVAGNEAPQTGRSATESSDAAAPRVAEEDADVAARRERDARNNSQPDDITAMQREADALAARSANLRQISDAAKPLYDSLDDHQRRLLVQFVHYDLNANDMDDSRQWRR